MQILIIRLKFHNKISTVAATTMAGAPETATKLATTTTTRNPCDDIICDTDGELCVAGKCMCGSSLTCSGNLQAPTCDIGINICRCGSGGLCEASEICKEELSLCISAP